MYVNSSVFKRSLHTHLGYQVQLVPTNRCDRHKLSALLPVLETLSSLSVSSNKKQRIRYTSEGWCETVMIMHFVLLRGTLWSRFRNNYIFAYLYFLCIFCHSKSFSVWKNWGIFHSHYSAWLESTQFRYQTFVFQYKWLLSKYGWGCYSTAAANCVVLYDTNPLKNGGNGKEKSQSMLQARAARWSSG